MLSDKDAIPKGAQFDSLKAKVRSHPSMKPNTLYQWYKMFDKEITDKNTISIFKRDDLNPIDPIDQIDVPIKFLKSSSEKNVFGYEKNKELRTKPNPHLKLPYSNKMSRN